MSFVNYMIFEKKIQILIQNPNKKKLISKTQNYNEIIANIFFNNKM